MYFIMFQPFETPEIDITHVVLEIYVWKQLL